MITGGKSTRALGRWAKKALFMGEVEVEDVVRVLEEGDTRPPKGQSRKQKHRPTSESHNFLKV